MGREVMDTAVTLVIVPFPVMIIPATILIVLGMRVVE